jgi:hypothetical protein
MLNGCGPCQLVMMFYVWYFMKTNKLLALFRVRVIVLFATFNTISAISYRSGLIVEKTKGPGKNHRPVTDKLHYITSYQVHLTTLSHNVISNRSII